MLEKLTEAHEHLIREYEKQKRDHLSRPTLTPSHHAVDIKMHFLKNNETPLKYPPCTQYPPCIQGGYNIHVNPTYLRSVPPRPGFQEVFFVVAFHGIAVLGSRAIPRFASVKMSPAEMIDDTRPM